MLSVDELNYLYQYACILTNNDDEAFDFVHEAVLVLQRYEPINPRAYAKITIRNLFYKKYHKNLKQNGLESDDISGFQELENQIIDRDSVDNILKNISASERELLFAWAVEGQTIQEIADETESKLGTLLSRINRMKKRILKMESHYDVI